MEPTTRVELVTCRLRIAHRRPGPDGNPRKQRTCTGSLGIIWAHLAANCGTKCGTAHRLLSRFLLFPFKLRFLCARSRGSRDFRLFLGMRKFPAPDSNTPH